MILNDFFTNDALNNEMTLVSGEDLCKMFDVCMFLGEQIDIQRAHAIATGTKIGKNYRRVTQQLQEKESIIQELQSNA